MTWLEKEKCCCSDYEWTEFPVSQVRNQSNHSLSNLLSDKNNNYAIVVLGLLKFLKPSNRKKIKGKIKKTYTQNKRKQYIKVDLNKILICFELMLILGNIYLPIYVMTQMKCFKWNKPSNIIKHHFSEIIKPIDNTHWLFTWSFSTKITPAA